MTNSWLLANERFNRYDEVVDTGKESYEMTKKEIRIRRWEYTRQFYKGNVGRLVAALLAIMAVAATNLLISYLLQVLIDAATGGQFSLEQTAGLCLLTVVLCAAFFALCYHARPRFLAKAMGQYKVYVFERLSRKGIAAFAKEDTSQYTSALSNDAAVIEKDYLANIFNLVVESVQFVGALGMMLWYSPLLTAIAIGLALLPVLASLMAGSRVAGAEKRLSQKNEAYMSTLRDGLEGFPVVKSFRAEKAMCAQFAQRVQEASQAKEGGEKARLFVQALGTVSGVIAQLGVFLAGGWLIAEGYGISGGVLVAFVNLMSFLISPIGTVPECLAQRRAATALIDKLANMLDSGVRETGKELLQSIEREIEVRNLSFSYDGENEVLHNINVTLRAGGSYAIVGGSGCGKTTFLTLLMAGYEQYTGQILLDGQELRDVTSESLYDNVSMVQQNVFIFNASIRDNITMFSDFPREEVDHAIRLSGLAPLIAQKGEDYLCGENGSGLSGGERQRISIARCLLKKSQVLLADEATASLDAQTACQVTDAILNLEGLTRVVVTHGLEEKLLTRYDEILAMRSGQIVERGTFRDLMEQKGYFYSLFTVSQ